MSLDQIKYEIRRPLRAFIIECYGLDIEKADFAFSTQNYAFIFPGHPFMIRVSMSPGKTRRQILSELMWVDDLKTFKQTICEPSPSLRGKLLEEIEIGGVIYRVSMFRTARGNVRSACDMDPMYFICVGETLGSIHAASVDENKQGIHFDRPTGYDKLISLCREHISDVPGGAAQSIHELTKALGALTRTQDNFGLCHGDFYGNNFFVDCNNIWLFDFDDCEYEFFMYDFATAILQPLLNGYHPDKDARTCLYEDILPYFKIGYELRMNVSNDYYDRLELFLRYRMTYSLLKLYDIKTCGMVKTAQLNIYRQAFNEILALPDFFGAITEFRNRVAAAYKDADG